MKYFVKSLILLIVGFLAIAGVLYFVKVIQAPPVQKEWEDQYRSHLETEIPDMRTHGDDLENSFQHLVDLHNRFLVEKAIDEKVYDEQMMTMLAHYVPHFTSESFKFFEGSNWPDTDIEFIENRINYLNNLTKLTDGKSYYIESLPEETSKFDDLTSIIARYRSAKNLSRKTSFVNWQDARKKLTDARNFANMPYLSNNRSLVIGLNLLPSKICDSQFNQLKNKVSKLSNPKDFDNVEEFREKMREVVSEINDYERNAPSVYHINVSKRKKELNDQCREYGTEAERYFSSVN